MTEIQHPPRKTWPKHPVQSAAAGALFLLCLAELAEIYSGAIWAKYCAILALLAFFVLGQAAFGLRERFLLAIAAMVTGAVFVFAPEPTDLIVSALSRASFLAAFMILLALLRDAAVTSNAVLGVGTYLTQQPSGRRYAAIHIGGHALGVILNFGALSLMGPLIQRGVGASKKIDPEVSTIRERRQLSALDRGFSWIIAWSPTAVSQAFIPAVIVGVNSGKMVMMGLSAAVIMFFVGWFEDRFRFRRTYSALVARGIAPKIEVPKFPKKDFLWFAGVCSVLGFFTLLVVVITGVRTVPALMLVAPLVTAWWIWLQNRKSSNPLAVCLARYRDIIMTSVPAGSPEALTLSAAGFIGLAAGGLAEAGLVAEGFRLSTPPVLLYIGVAAIIPITSNAALPPIMIVSFLAVILTPATVPGLDPTLLGLSCALGWALNLTGSPFGASSLILSRVTGIAGTTLSWRWNGVFTIAAFCVVAILLSIFSLF